MSMHRLSSGMEWKAGVGVELRLIQIIGGCGMFSFLKKKDMKGGKRDELLFVFAYESVDGRNIIAV